MVRQTLLSLPRLLTRLPDPPTRPDDLGEELDESDVVWSSYPDETQSSTPTTSAVYSLSSSAVPLFSSPPSAGLSAALFAPDSPRSIQRKTTSSPVAMIPATKSSDTGGAYYYGRKVPQSAPVNVPVWPGRRRGGPLGFDDVDEDGFHDDEGMVPPHEIVARSHKTTTFSVMEGAGRTLKGRDLTTVRNAVFQSTGFL